MERRSGALRGILIASTVLVLAGCATDDQVYVSNFADAHGRACTFVYTAREGEGFFGGGRDVDVSQLDCEYPPADRTPAPSTTIRLDPVPAGG